MAPCQPELRLSVAKIKNLQGMHWVRGGCKFLDMQIFRPPDCGCVGLCPVSMIGLLQRWPHVVKMQLHGAALRCWLQLPPDCRCVLFRALLWDGQLMVSIAWRRELQKLLQHLTCADSLLSHCRSDLLQRLLQVHSKTRSTEVALHSRSLVTCRCLLQAAAQGGGGGGVWQDACTSQAAEIVAPSAAEGACKGGFLWGMGMGSMPGRGYNHSRRVARAAAPAVGLGAGR